MHVVPANLVVLWLQVGVRCVKLEGSMSMDARQKTIKAFNEDSNVPCFLMSLKAGGVALNLTVASHVMLMGACCTLLSALALVPSHIMCPV